MLFCGCLPDRAWVSRICISFVDWSPDLAGLPFSAHPKVEPDGTLWNIGCVLAPRPVLLFYRIDRTGRLVSFVDNGVSVGFAGVITVPAHP